MSFGLSATIAFGFNETIAAGSNYMLEDGTDSILIYNNSSSAITLTQDDFIYENIFVVG